jgi:hypothetical protein
LPKGSAPICVLEVFSPRYLHPRQTLRGRDGQNSAAQVGTANGEGTTRQLVQALDGHCRTTGRGWRIISYEPMLEAFSKAVAFWRRQPEVATLLCPTTPHSGVLADRESQSGGYAVRWLLQCRQAKLTPQMPPPHAPVPEPASSVSRTQIEVVNQLVLTREVFPPATRACKCARQAPRSLSAHHPPLQDRRDAFQALARLPHRSCRATSSTSSAEQQAPSGRAEASTKSLRPFLPVTAFLHAVAGPGSMGCTPLLGRACP